MDTCEPAIANNQTLVRNEQPLLGRHYYGKRNGEFFTSVQVGSADIDRSLLRCKIFFMASCSSKVHFFKPLDRRRKALRSSCVFYMTQNVCATSHATHFITEVFNGTDPTSARGKRRMLRALNGVSDSGIVEIL